LDIRNAVVHDVPLFKIENQVLWVGSEAVGYAVKKAPRI